MRRRFLSWILVFCTLGLLTLSACTAKNSAEPSAVPEDIRASGTAGAFAHVTEDAWHTEAIQISVGGKDFKVDLAENAASRALAERLPFTVTMDELNGNEKYYDLPESLPTAPEQPGSIQAGDLMLYGSDCLVLFYESFASSYAYTRLGWIADPDGLAEAVGGGEVEVTFRMEGASNPMTED